LSFLLTSSNAPFSQSDAVGRGSVLRRKQRKECNLLEVFSEPIPDGLNAKQRMEYKLKAEAGKKIYAKRKTIIEPIFGQIKDCRRIRTFLMRGIDEAKGEWNLICATHNLLKIFRRNALQMA